MRKSVRTKPLKPSFSFKAVGKKSTGLSRGSRAMDPVFLILVFILLAFGLVMLFSASFARAYYYKQGNSFHFIFKQSIHAALGLLAMFFMSKIDYNKLKKFAIPLFLISLCLLVVVLFMKGDSNGIKRWIQFGPFFQFQPSELMKFSLILLFSSMISANQSKMKTFGFGVLLFSTLLGIVVALMYLEPHLSGIILMCSIAGVMMFVGGTRPRWFIILFLIAGAALVYILFFKGNYMGGRVYYWLHPFSDPIKNTMQTDQSLLAIGSGGVFGLGLGRSRQKFMYLPEVHNDFIFAVICEELGIVGAVVVIVLFLLFCYKGFEIASKSKDKFGTLLCAGIVAQFGIQAMFNIAVVTATVPNTGISLPFFSYGGTALAMQLAEMGVVLSVSRHALTPKLSGVSRPLKKRERIRG